MKPTRLSHEQKCSVYTQRKAENFVESMRLEGYSVDASLLALTPNERKQKKAELIKQFTK
ncbi:YhfG family protein [Rhodanobacter aciditrophus]|uniref:YhfG family protein n=1 Tax=Rhodanobacter aciditrophus TaxID=1623218 RepID=A0ABW4AZ84_9GAMM